MGRNQSRSCDQRCSTALTARSRRSCAPAPPCSSPRRVMRAWPPPAGCKRESPPPRRAAEHRPRLRARRPGVDDPRSGRARRPQLVRGREAPVHAGPRLRRRPLPRRRRLPRPYGRRPVRVRPRLLRARREHAGRRPASDRRLLPRRRGAGAGARAPVAPRFRLRRRARSRRGRAGARAGGLSPALPRRHRRPLRAPRDRSRSAVPADRRPRLGGALPRHPVRLHGAGRGARHVRVRAHALHLLLDLEARRRLGPDRGRARLRRRRPAGFRELPARPRALRRDAAVLDAAGRARAGATPEPPDLRRPEFWTPSPPTCARRTP